MTGTLAAGCLVIGLLAGWLLRTVAVMAEISRAQERLQNKIRYWQSETFHARYQAERLARILGALGWPPEDADDEPPQDQ